MIEEKQDANTQENPSTPALETAIAESVTAEEVQQHAQDTQTPTAEQGESQEQEVVEEQGETEEQVPFHKHPRFKELTDENRWLKENMQSMIQRQQEAQG